jgi:Tfp pilus assembly protein PilF
MNKTRKDGWLRAVVSAVACMALVTGGVAQTPNQPPGNTPSKVEPKFTPTSEQVGDSLMAHQHYQAAIEAYKKGPNNSAELWNKMGVAYQLMYNQMDAARCYQMALKLNPKNAVVLNNLGTINVALKQYSAAERLYKKAL